MATLSAFIDSGEVHRVLVECVIHSRSLPQLIITGLPTLTVRESRERILSALRAAKIRLPRSRVVIQLLPSDLKKKGTTLDLAMVVALLRAQGHKIPEMAAIGEVDITGKIMSSSNILALAENLITLGPVLVPASASELAYCSHPEKLVPVNSVADLLDVSTFSQKKAPMSVVSPPADNSENLLPLARDHAQVLSLVAAGGHTALLFGSPGKGKSESRHWLKFLLPTLTETDQTELAVLQARLGRKEVHPLPEVVMPHPTTTTAQMIGGRGKTWALLYESQFGVLFLDEMSEFRKEVLELLRHPMERAESLYGMSKSAREMCCRTTVVGTTNPCRCGYYGEDACRCSQEELRQYYQKFSGAVLDRFALFYRVQQNGVPDTESPQSWKTRVQLAYDAQVQRRLDGFPANNVNYQAEHLEKLTALPVVWIQRTATWSFRRQVQFRQVVQTIRDIFPDATTEASIQQAYMLVKPNFVPKFS